MLRDGTNRFCMALADNVPGVSKCNKGLFPSIARYISNNVIYLGSFARVGLACPVVLIISPDLRNNDMICRI